MASAQDFTSTALLASIKRRGMIVGATDTWSDADLLALATEEMQSYVMSVLMDVREDYRTADYDVATVASTATYRLPERAAGDSLRNVLYSSDGGLEYSPLVRVDADQAGASATLGTPYGFYFKDTDVVLVPTPAIAGTLRLQYPRRPSKLVAASAVATIAPGGINGNRTVITTTATIPSTFTSGVTVDVVDNNPGFKILTMDAATTGTVSGTTITLSAALPASVAAGDYVCLAGESVVPQIPVEMHPLLAARTVEVALEALGDKKSVVAAKRTETMRREAIGMMTQRSKGSVRALVNRYGVGQG